MSNNIAKIWCVFQPQGKAPRATHHTIDAAINEAKRLAELNPGSEFYVMESCGVAIKQSVSYYPHRDKIPKDLDFLEDEVPF